MRLTPDELFEIELAIYTNVHQAYAEAPDGLKRWLWNPPPPTPPSQIYSRSAVPPKPRNRDVYAHGHERKTRSRS